MTTMKVVSMAPGEFGVEVEEGHEVTGHKVRLPPAFLDDLLLADIDQERIVRETFGSPPVLLLESVFTNPSGS